MKVLAVIPARSKSRRVKHKNIRELGGHPLIYYTIREALKAKTLDEIVFSSDSPKYLGIAAQCTENMPHSHFFVRLRPKELGEDVDTTLVLKDVVKHSPLKDIDWIVCLQPTSPLRIAEDIDTCVELAKETNCDTVVSIRKATEYPEWMIGFYADFRFLHHDMLKGEKLVSQNLPKYYYPNGAVYVAKCELIKQGRIFGDDIKFYVMPSWRSIDIEEEIDFIIAEALLKWKGKSLS